MVESEQEVLRAKALRIEAALTEAYGSRQWDRANYTGDLVGGLIGTVLSQNTNDLNSGRAYISLKTAFPTGWDEVRRAPVSQIAAALTVGGLANIKAARIKTILEGIYEKNDAVCLDNLNSLTTENVREYLKSFPGVGPKTAACVLMFNMGRSALPIDTHVLRVTKRLGLIRMKVDANGAHDLLAGIIEPSMMYSFHVHIIEHGRTICGARAPKCQSCNLKSECEFYCSQMHRSSVN